MSEFSPISYKFIAAAALTASKTHLYRMEPQRGTESSVGIHPGDALGRFYLTDLSLGRGEKASDIRMSDAVCSVSASKNIVKTSLVGLKGTIKEYIAAGDYEVSITVGLVAVDKEGKVVDEYPEEGVRRLRELLDHTAALHVDSAFLRLFDITRLVIVDYKIEQMTYSNRQVITIRAISDEDYVIRHNTY